MAAPDEPPKYSALHDIRPVQAKYDGLKALEDRVEKAHAPSTLVAVDENSISKGYTLPMGVYPAWPKYSGPGYRCTER